MLPADRQRHVQKKKATAQADVMIAEDCKYQLVQFQFQQKPTCRIVALKHSVREGYMTIVNFEVQMVPTSHTVCQLWQHLAQYALKVEAGSVCNCRVTRWRARG